MDNKQFLAMGKSLMSQARRYPNCTIANCDCNSKEGKWIGNCGCMCHFRWMDKKYGVDNWSFHDFTRERNTTDRLEQQ